MIGVPDDEYGQRLAAFVVGAETLTAEHIREHVKANLARFSVPRDVFFLDELPRNATGKVLKRQLPRAGLGSAPKEGGLINDGSRPDR